MDRRDWWRLAGFGDIVGSHDAERRGRHSQTEFGNEKRGYVDLPEHWRYSSARDYNGQKGLVEISRVW